MFAEEEFYDSDGGYLMKPLTKIFYRIFYTKILHNIV